MKDFSSYELVRKLNDVKSESGGTSLITIFIPPNSNLNLTSNQLNSELSTSQNIKNKNIKSSVQSAIKSAQQQLKLLGQLSPDNGLVLCSGSIQYCI